MTTFLLLRHAHSVANKAGILAGQLEGIGLSKDGIAQVKKLTSSFENLKIDRIISSPMQRCLETVEGIARSKRKRISIDKRLIEMNYGSWSGKKLSKLSRMKEWKVIQAKPSAFRFPQGESFKELEERIESLLKDLSRKYPKETILLITHGDIVKIAASLTVGSGLDNFQKFAVDPCSLTTLSWSSKARLLLTFNQKIVSINSSKKKKRRDGNTLGGSKDVA
ncbi:MAG: histidine phosphatase family protein [Candidatus Nanopelagicaceae bacterium]